MTDTPTLERPAAPETSPPWQSGAGHTRGGFLGRLALAGGLTAGALAGFADPAEATSASDVDILNYALTLEYLEAAFYAEAEVKAGLSGKALRLAQVVGAHERAHVAALKKVLGRSAVASPRFDFGAATRSPAAFLKTANVLEDTGVAAYKGQVGNIKSAAVLKAALSIHTVEARHASWVRRRRGVVPAPVAFDKPLSKQQVLDAVGKTGFIVDASTTTRADPQFNG